MKPIAKDPQIKPKDDKREQIMANRIIFPPATLPRKPALFRRGQCRLSCPK